MGRDSRIRGMSDWSALRVALKRPLRVALLPCAGRGDRSGADRPKQYVEIVGRSVVHWTLSAFDELFKQGELDGLVVVLAAGDEAFDQVVPPELRSRLQVVTAGGATRAQSVLGGLRLLARQGVSSEDWVLVHDAARCLVEPLTLLQLIRECDQDPVGGLLAHPIADTLKRADPQGRIQATVPREHLWAAQTPQMFRMGRLLDSLERALQAGAVVTDEASALEWAGYSPRLVIGPAENFKLTYPEDFRRAAWVLQQRVNSAGGSP